MLRCTLSRTGSRRGLIRDLNYCGNVTHIGEAHMKYHVRAMLWSLFAVCLCCQSQGAAPQDQQAPATGKPACSASLDGLYGFVASGFVPVRQANGAFHQTSIEELGQIMLLQREWSQSFNSLRWGRLRGKAIVSSNEIRHHCPRGAGHLSTAVMVLPGAEIRVMPSELGLPE